MSDLKEVGRPQELQDEVCREKKISAEALRHLLATVEQYTDSHRAHGFPDELLRVFNDELFDGKTRSSRGNEAHSETLAEV